MPNIEDCLAGTLTILCKLGIMNEDEIDKAKEQGFEGIFEYINQKYKDIESED